MLQKCYESVNSLLQIPCHVTYATRTAAAVGPELVLSGDVRPFKAAVVQPDACYDIQQLLYLAVGVVNLHVIHRVCAQHADVTPYQCILPIQQTRTLPRFLVCTFDSVKREL